MLVSADEWKSRIWRAGEETERRDYRATEAKVHHRLRHGPLVQRMGPPQPPGRPLRRPRPRPHLAVGPRRPRPPRPLTHLDLSPAWRGTKPTATDRHHYRQFADSLDERQQFELASSLHKRA